MTIHQDIKDIIAEGLFTVASIGLMFTGFGELEFVARGLTYGNVISGIGQSFSGVRDIFSSNMETREMGEMTLALGATDIIFGKVASKELSSEIQLVSKIKQHDDIIQRLGDNIENLTEQRKGVGEVITNINNHAKNLMQSYSSQVEELTRLTQQYSEDDKVSGKIEERAKEIRAEVDTFISYIKDYRKKDIPYLQQYESRLKRQVLQIEMDRNSQLIGRNHAEQALQLTRQNRNIDLVLGDVAANIGNVLNLSKSNYFFT
jgi:archaellum component FlaC